MNEEPARASRVRHRRALVVPPAVARARRAASLAPMSELPRDPRSIHVGAPVATAPAEPVAPTPTPARRRRRRRWPWVVAVVVLVTAVPGLLFAVAAWGSWRDVERVELSGVLAGSPSGTNYLVVGTDSSGSPSATPNGMACSESVAICPSRTTA